MAMHVRRKYISTYWVYADGGQPACVETESEYEILSVDGSRVTIKQVDEDPYVMVLSKADSVMQGDSEYSDVFSRVDEASFRNKIANCEK